MLQHGKTYTVRNTATNTYLDVDEYDDTSVIGHQNNGGRSNQKWVASQDGSYWTFQNLHTGTYLGPDADVPDDMGARITVSSTRSTWQVGSATWDRYRDLYTLTYGVSLIRREPLVLDLDKSSPENGADVILWEPHGGQNQTWEFIAV